jgi:hypothetical protein
MEMSSSGGPKNPLRSLIVNGCDTLQMIRGRDRKDMEAGIWTPVTKPAATRQSVSLGLECLWKKDLNICKLIVCLFVCILVGQ